MNCKQGFPMTFAGSGARVPVEVHILMSKYVN